MKITLSVGILIRLLREELRDWQGGPAQATKRTLKRIAHDLARLHAATAALGIGKPLHFGG